MSFQRPIAIGIDFDNTIISYDKVFSKVAKENNLIPLDLPENKNSVRDFLRKNNKEDIWTELQGKVYGTFISYAPPFEGVLDFLRMLNANEIFFYIVSHKTHNPYAGPKVDLHEAALGWLTKNNFFADNSIGLNREKVFFELTKGAKIRRIESLGCTHFIDDLPEFLLEASFPSNTQKILFDPNNLHQLRKNELKIINSWKSVQSYFEAEPFFNSERTTRLPS